MFQIRFPTYMNFTRVFLIFYVFFSCGIRFLGFILESRKYDAWGPPIGLSSNARRTEIGRCHTLFREKGNEASIRVPRMFKSHAWQQYDKQMQCY
jgi:hypothetical protein